MVKNYMSFEQQEENFVQQPGPKNATRRIQKAKAKCMKRMFEGMRNENEAQINVIRK